MEQFKLRIDIFNILKQPYVFQTTRLSRGLTLFFFCIVPHTVILNLWPDLWEKSSPIWLLSSEITPSARQQRMNSPSWDFWDDVEIANKWCRKNRLQCRVVWRSANPVSPITLLQRPVGQLECLFESILCCWLACKLKQCGTSPKAKLMCHKLTLWPPALRPGLAHANKQRVTWKMAIHA